jgi:sugar transferase EpsL
MRRGYDEWKRIIDIVLATILLVVLLPLLLVIGLLVRLFVGSPILFRQIRVGWGLKPYAILKFRTMTDNLSGEESKHPDAKRVTRLGYFLRAFSLDELPQLWNIIKGEMSIVGPRPLLLDYVPHYTADQRRRHDVRPGLTGWAQVNGRHTVPWPERFAMDVWYVDNRSFRLDLFILWRSIGAVFQRTGVSGPGQVTVSEFTGRANNDMMSQLHSPEKTPSREPFN